MGRVRSIVSDNAGNGEQQRHRPDRIRRSVCRAVLEEGRCHDVHRAAVRLGVRDELTALYALGQPIKSKMFPIARIVADGDPGKLP